MKIPKRHLQANLPVGTRIRFLRGKELRTGHTAALQAADGTYEVRPLHGFHRWEVKAENIKFLEYIPGAPTPIPTKWGEAFVNMQGRVEKYCPCPPPLKKAIVDSAVGLTNLTKFLAPAKGPIIEADFSQIETKTLASLIAKGELDEMLNQLQEEIHARVLIVRAMKAQQNKAALKPGDRVKVCGRIRPKKLVGMTGKVERIDGTKFIKVTFDGVKAFHDSYSGRTIGIPANCLEKLP